MRSALASLAAITALGGVVHAAKGDPHAHFAQQAKDAATLVSWSLRDEAQLARHPKGVGRRDTSLFDYDPVHDGMRLTLSRERWRRSKHPNPEKPGMSVDNKRMLVLRHEVVTPEDKLYSAQVEFRLSKAYGKDTARAIGWNGALKFITMRNAKGQKNLELLFACQGRDWTCMPRWRAYHRPDDIREPHLDSAIIRLKRPQDGDRDLQPSDRTAAFDSERPFDWRDHLAMLKGNTQKPLLLPAEEWCRYTLHIEFVSEDEILHTGYIACESFDPIKFLSSKANAPKGINIVNKKPERRTIGFLYIPEHNSSRGGTFGSSGIVAESWYRNAVVMRGKLIPLGGRPVGH